MEIQIYLCTLQVFCQLQAFRALFFDKTLRSAEIRLVGRKSLTEQIIFLALKKSRLKEVFLIYRKSDLPQSLWFELLAVIYSSLMASTVHCSIDLTDYLYHCFIIRLCFAFLSERLICFLVSIHYVEGKEIQLTCKRLKVHRWSCT